MQAYFFQLLAASFNLGLTLVAFGQTLGPAEDLLPQSVVTAGRNLILAAPETAGSVQWEIQIGPGEWRALRDDSTYHGTSTKFLEIAGASAGLSGSVYRFVDSSKARASNATKLLVSPRLLPMPVGLSLDGSGGLYVSDASTHTIRRISNADLYGFGNLSDLNGSPLLCIARIIAGKTEQAGAVDGAPEVSLFNQPAGIDSGPTGTPSSLVVADAANGTIRRIDLPGGNVTTLAGSSSLRGSSDGAGPGALFSNPTAVTRARDGTVFVADSANHTIRKIAVDGTVSTFAGSPGTAGWAEGRGAAARFNNPSGIAVDPMGSGTVFVADTGNHVIRRITPIGEVTTLAGLAGVSGTEDGVGSRARFNGPTGLVITPGGGVFVADTGNATIRFVDLAGEVSTFAGTAGVAGLQDTLPLTEEPIAYDFPSGVFPAAPPTFSTGTSATTPTTPTTTPATAPTSASSGGGAIGAELILVLGAIAWLRKRASTTR